MNSKIFYGILAISIISILIISGCAQEKPKEPISLSSKTLLEIQECSRYKYDVKKDNCILLAAYKNDEIKTCDYISFSGDKEFCLGLLKGDVSICESSFEQDVFKNSCIALIAALKKDETICNEITSENKEMEKAIKEGCLAKVFIEKGDPSSCEKFSKDLSFQCKLLVAVENEDLDFCQSLSTSESLGGSEQEICIMSIAINKKDDSLCSQLKTEITKKSCFTQVAFAKKDAFICEKISKESSKAYCYLNVAIAKNDVSLCGKAQNKEQCISELAAYNVDLSLCENLEDVYKDGCIYNIAYAKNDPLLCERIINKGTKDMCLSSIKAIPKMRDFALNLLSQSS